MVCPRNGFARIKVSKLPVTLEARLAAGSFCLRRTASLGAALEATVLPAAVRWGAAPLEGTTAVLEGTEAAALSSSCSGGSWCE